ncbi:MAG: alpha/beta hydrolase [Actinomycetes bacterium]
MATRAVVRGTLSKEAALTRGQLAEQLQYVMNDDAQREFILAMVRTASFRPPRKAGRDNDKVQFAGIVDLRLERIQAPVLLVHGEVDTEVSPNDSYSASARLPRSELEMVPLGGHACADTPELLSVVGVLDSEDRGLCASLEAEFGQDA